MARALRRLADDEQLTTRLGVGARERFERLYSADVTMGQLLQIYREAIAARQVETSPARTTSAVR
jgi:glycosyltransferase involved in cell wall biosynthesis